VFMGLNDLVLFCIGSGEYDELACASFVCTQLRPFSVTDCLAQQ
jgi:hypothetical protein